MYSVANINEDGKYFQVLRLKAKGKVYMLPNEPNISLTASNTIVKTDTVGSERKGTVKEYICAEDWILNIKGVCVNEDSKSYPYQQVKQLIELRNLNVPLEVLDNPFFELHGIRKIVIEDLVLPEMMGRPNQQVYEIKAVSEEDFYAVINGGYALGNSNVKISDDNLVMQNKINQLPASEFSKDLKLHEAEEGTITLTDLKKLKDDKEKAFRNSRYAHTKAW